MSLISIKHEKDYRVRATIRRHQLVLDVPANQGGTDAGPTPVELLAAALGSCVAMHVAKYCKGAKLPYEGFGIDVDHQVVTNPLRIGSMAVDITMPPDFPEDRFESVKRAAQQCTVKNTLKDTTAVDVEVYVGV